MPPFAKKNRAAARILRPFLKAETIVATEHIMLYKLASPETPARAGD
jgi:hypothetical protein